MNDVQKIRELFEESLPVFSALGDPIRQQLIMLMLNMEGEKSVAELAASTALSRPTVSHHLKILKNAHMLGEKKKGTKTYYHPQMGAYFKPIHELVSLVVKLEKEKGNKH